PRDCNRFFFQAEDGIRDRNVTGVQTCALPISVYARTLIRMEENRSHRIPLVSHFSKNAIEERIRAIMKIRRTTVLTLALACLLRSEERRVGKEWRAGRAGERWKSQEETRNHGA